MTLPNARAQPCGKQAAQRTTERKRKSYTAILAPTIPPKKRQQDSPIRIPQAISSQVGRYKFRHKNFQPVNKLFQTRRHNHAASKRRNACKKKAENYAAILAPNTIPQSLSPKKIPKKKPPKEAANSKARMRAKYFRAKGMKLLSSLTSGVKKYFF